jgi:hypothetical protein
MIGARAVGSLLARQGGASSITSRSVCRAARSCSSFATWRLASRSENRLRTRPMGRMERRSSAVGCSSRAASSPLGGKIEQARRLLQADKLAQRARLGIGIDQQDRMVALKRDAGREIEGGEALALAGAGARQHEQIRMRAGFGTRREGGPQDLALDEPQLFRNAARRGRAGHQSCPLQQCQRHIWLRGAVARRGKRDFLRAGGAAA